MLDINRKIYERIKNMLVWGGLLLVVSFALALVLFEIEKGVPGSSFKTLGDLYWWWVNIMGGVGASNVPSTPQSFVIATGILFLSFILLGLVISEISAVIRMVYARREEGNIKIRYQGHIVIFGYTSLTAAVIKLLRRSFGQQIKIVLISNDIEFNPFPGQADFISDNPINLSTLADANVQKATAAIILANDRFRDPDTYSLVIASGIEKQSSKVVTVVELINQQNKDLFKLTDIDGFIDRRELIEDLLQKTNVPKLLRIIQKESTLETIADKRLRPDAPDDLL